MYEVMIARLDRKIAIFFICLTGIMTGMAAIIASEWGGTALQVLLVGLTAGLVLAYVERLFVAEVREILGL